MYLHAQNSSTPKPTLSEKSSDGRPSFVDFILSTRAKKSKTGDARADLVALYKTLISAKAFPTITRWADLYRFMCRRSASPDALDEARKLWASYKSKYQPAASPGTSRRIDDG